MKKLVSLLLALCMLCSIAAVASAEGELKKVTISILGNYDERNHAEDRSDCPQYLLDDYEYIRHELLPGYEIEIQWRLYDDRQQQLPLLMAANDVPDIVIADGTTYMEYMDTDYFLEDLMPMLEEYGKNILAGVEQRSLDLCTLQGRGLVAIPSENFYYKFRTIIRTDWVEKLGFEVKKVYTLSEIKDIWQAMATQDPDGNGVADTFGLGTRFNGGDWTQSFMPILGAFGGMIDQFYVDDETKTAYCYNYSDDFRAALSWLHEIYAMGAMDPEIFVLNYDQAKIKAAQGKAGTFSGWWNVMGNLLDAGLLEIQPEARLDFIYITSDDGKTEGNKDNGTIWKTALISNQCEAPEAAIAIIDYMHTWEGQGHHNAPILDENGQYTYEEGQEPSPLTMIRETINWAKEAGTTDEDAQYQKGWRKSPFDNLFNNMKLRQGDQNRMLVRTMPDGGNDPAVYTTLEWRQEYRNYLNYIGDMMHDNPDHMGVYTSDFYGLPVTQEALDYSAGLNTLTTDWVVDLVTGKKDVNDDAVWAQYLKEANAKGAQEVLNSFLAEYNELNGTDYTAVTISK